MVVFIPYGNAAAVSIRIGGADDFSTYPFCQVYSHLEGSRLLRIRRLNRWELASVDALFLNEMDIGEAHLLQGPWNDLYAATVERSIDDSEVVMALDALRRNVEGGQILKVGIVQLFPYHLYEAKAFSLGYFRVAESLTAFSYAFRTAIYGSFAIGAIYGSIATGLMPLDLGNIGDLVHLRNDILVVRSDNLGPV